MSDPITIDVYNPIELSYWTMGLQVTDEELKLAVAEVGPYVTDVCRKIYGQQAAIA
ncbi:MAG: DUF3606 domain-containing protein [Sphingobacteriales bacterium]|nr:MAG: DUF3606 domain-containing protein [Sphingobacteriales bacterium]